MTPNAKGLSLTLQPFRPSYTPGDTVKVQLLSMQNSETALSVPGATYRAEPAELATGDGNGEFTFAGPGSVDLIGCDGDRCVTKSLVISTALQFEIQTPVRGQFLHPENPAEGLAVRGVIGAFTGTASVTVNDGEQVSVGSETDGTFTTTIAPTFGYNRIKVAVKDDATPIPVVQYFEIIWTPAVLLLRMTLSPSKTPSSNITPVHN